MGGPQRQLDRINEAARRLDGSTRALLTLLRRPTGVPGRVRLSEALSSLQPLLLLLLPSASALGPGTGAGGSAGAAGPRRAGGCAAHPGAAGGRADAARRRAGAGADACRWPVTLDRRHAGWAGAAGAGRRWPPWPRPPAASADDGARPSPHHPAGRCRPPADGGGARTGAVLLWQPTARSARSRRPFAGPEGRKPSLRFHPCLCYRRRTGKRAGGGGQAHQALRPAPPLAQHLLDKQGQGSAPPRAGHNGRRN